MRLHLLGLPHTQTTRETVVCAFTAKLVKFAEMMADLFEIVVYSGDRNDAPCYEHVPLFAGAEQRGWYGDIDANVLPTVARFDSGETPWRQFNAAAITALRARLEPRDLILILGGNAQRPVADAFPNHISCEWAAGYDGIFSPYVCFESHAWMHYLYGKMRLGEGRWFDAVIPNFFRPDDFAVADETADYLLFVGRLIERKGLLVASDIAREAGLPLVVAGSGAAEWDDGYLRTLDGCELRGDVRYEGAVGAERRNELMGAARAVLVPTTYIEPFGAVAVEAQLCGTPAITTDWGAFSETVSPDFRFRTLAEAIRCVDRATDIDAEELREVALERYSLDAIRPLYANWLERLSSLWADGWYAKNGSAPKSLTSEAMPS